MEVMARRPAVHLLTRIPGMLEVLGTLHPDIPVVRHDPSILAGEAESQLAQAEILLSDPNLIQEKGLVQKLPNVKWLQSTFAGNDKLIQSLDKTKPIPAYTLTKFGGSFGPLMAEYVIGYIIASERKFINMHQMQVSKSWNQEAFSQYRSLAQLRIGILGAGEIGKQVAKMAKNLGMETWGLVRQEITPDRKCPHMDHYRMLSGLPELLQSCDYICNVLPSTRETKGLLCGDILSHCKQKKSVFINIGRGDIIDENTILKALDEGWISSAILDVLYEEPLPTESRLWSHPNVIVTPHVSGITFAQQMVELFAENYAQYIAGKPLKYIVDWEAGY